MTNTSGVRLRDIYGDSWSGAGDAEVQKQKLIDYLDARGADPVDVRPPLAGELYVPTGYSEGSPLYSFSGGTSNHPRLIVRLRSQRTHS